MKLTDTIIDLCLQMMLDNSINTGAIYDHICDIVFDLYKIMTNTEVFNVTLTKQLIDICKETYDVKVNDYVDFISEGLTDKIKKDSQKLDSFMNEKACALIPLIENHLIEHYDIFQIHQL